MPDDAMTVSMSRKTLEIAHVVIESTKSAADIRAALETSDTTELKIVLRHDRGDIAQYEIGGPPAALSTSRSAPGIALYAPLRIIVYANEDGGSRIEYDLPSSLFAQFGDEPVTEVALGLDVALGLALSAAAG